MDAEDISELKEVERRTAGQIFLRFWVENGYYFPASVAGGFVVLLYVFALVLILLATGHEQTLSRVIDIFYPGDISIDRTLTVFDFAKVYGYAFLPYLVVSNVLRLFRKGRQPLPFGKAVLAWSLPGILGWFVVLFLSGKILDGLPVVLVFSGFLIIGTAICIKLNRMGDRLVERDRGLSDIL